MKLNFTSLVLTDFKSFGGGPHVLNFNKHPLGLCYVKGHNESDERLGSNGSGKSSLWDALTWCLYGKTVKSERNTDIRSWFGGSKASVQLDVNIDDEDYAILRATNPSRLRINGKDVGQDEVESLIGLKYETFLNTILLGQGRPLFFDLESSTKLQLFSDVLDLGRWEERSKQASATVSELDRDLQKADRELSGIEARAAQVKEDLKKSKARRDAWADENQAEVAELQKKLVSSETQLDAFKIRLAEKEVEEDLVATQYALSEKDSRAMFKQLFERRDRMSAADATKRGLERSIAGFENEIKDVGDSEVCPTCGQDLEGTGLGKHISELRSKIKQARKEIAALKIDSLVADYKVLEEQTNTLTDLLNADEKKIKLLRTDIEHWRRRCAEAEVEVRSCKDTLERLETATNPYSKSVRESTTLLSSLRTELSEKQAEKDKIATSIRRTKYWVKGFKDIRLLITEEVLQELELVTTSMLQEVGLVGWYVKYDIERETSTGSVSRGLNLEVFNPAYGKPVKWKSWSGGEAQRLRVIGSLALAEVLLNHAGVTTDMEILDEPIRHMGDEGVEDLCELLFDRSRTLKRQIWYIDHHTVEGDCFDSIVEVVKDVNRNSTIVRG